MHWFLDPIKNHYADFSGRASRKEFWMFYLAYILIVAVLGFIEGFISGLTGGQIYIFQFVLPTFILAIIIPMFAINARRLHDTGMTGWWQLVNFIPFVGWIILIVLTVRPSVAGANEYGPHPYGDVGAAPTDVPPPTETPSAADTL